jgi:hypothetical protein
MRCYFMRGGHIVDVQELPGLSNEEATAKAHALFLEREHLFEGFELWDRTRLVIKYSARSPPSIARGPHRHRGP